MVKSCLPFLPFSNRIVFDILDQEFIIPLYKYMCMCVCSSICKICKADLVFRDAGKVSILLNQVFFISKNLRKEFLCLISGFCFKSCVSRSMDFDVCTLCFPDSFLNKTELLSKMLNWIYREFSTFLTTSYETYFSI